MACRFSGTPDEIGFIMLHVYINELSPALVDGIMRVGKGEDINANLKRTALTMKDINARRKEMWAASRHERYNDFRIFIMGIKGNEALYGDGLVYEGCFNDEPQQYRGQTGAQDSLIPMMDIFSGVVDHYPDNKLTEYLMDLRTYRPKCIQEFFIDLRAHYSARPLFQTLKESGDYEAMIYLLSVVNEVYLFRNGHWQFVQKYIMANTKYPKATGGTPITSWLINQIEAVLHYEGEILRELDAHAADFKDALSAEAAEWYSDLSSTYTQKRRLLEDQVKLLQESDIDVALVYKTNQTYGLEDSEKPL
jgi:indoleamine 2,3-dioxygenase